MTPVIVYPHVTFDENDLPVIAGTRVPVHRLFWWHKVKHIAVDTLIKRYPVCGPAAVLSALAFAYDNEALVCAAYKRIVGHEFGAGVAP